MTVKGLNPPVACYSSITQSKLLENSSFNRGHECFEVEYLITKKLVVAHLMRNESTTFVGSLITTSSPVQNRKGAWPFP